MYKEIIVKTLNELRESDYRVGFNDSVLSRVCDALDGSYRDQNTPAGEMWFRMCSGERKTYIAKTYGQDVQDLYNEVDEMSRGKGAFVMPEWGTRGT